LTQVNRVSLPSATISTIVASFVRFNRGRVNYVVTWLSHHDVLATEQVHSECGHAGAQLERTARDVGAGLIVAGAYGHSRFRESILGGATERLVNPLGRCSLSR
jgi:nucleotide-binding universal stress UspA family protein